MSASWETGDSIPGTFPCPYCGEAVEVGALSCPHCGSDKETGWSEDPEDWAGDAAGWGAEIPSGYDEKQDFDYNAFLHREFPEEGNPAPPSAFDARKAFAAIVVVILTVAMVSVWVF